MRIRYAIDGVEDGGEMMRNWILVICLCLGVMPVAAAQNTVPFEVWLEQFKQEAQSRGIKPATLERAFAGVQHIDRVIELDRSQPEFKLTLDQYVQRAVTKQRIDKGRQRYREHRQLFKDIRKRYGVQPQYLLAFWGMETEYGRSTGGFPIIAALATLAYDGRRSEFFRGQLLDALTIVDQGHIEPEKMMGSWAGAMGQSQFMPSTFLKYAVDFDGDQRIDIWNSTADVLASAANYLSQVGWQDHLTWGREVLIPEEIDPALFGYEQSKLLSEWQALGVRRLNGKDLPQRVLAAHLIQPDGPGGRTFLIYSNFRAILHWNRSEKFAVSVGTLADSIIKAEK